MSALKIVFAGTPEFAAQHLVAICEQSDHQICAVYTQPDRPKGRGKKLIPSPVKAYAQTQDIPVYQPLSLKDDEQQSILASHDADIMVVVAYGLILPVPILETPRLGCINVHGSLLPRWRGAAPIERAIEAGDATTGITIMQMAEGLDDGDMLLKSELPILPMDTGDDLRTKLAEQGCGLLLQALSAFANQQDLSPEPQNHDLANYAHKLKKPESHIDWQQSAQTIHNKVRAFTSQNICSVNLNEQVIKIWQTSVQASEHQASAGEIINVNKEGVDVACGEQILRIEKVQLPGKNVLLIKDILNGRPDLFQVGATFC